MFNAVSEFCGFVRCRKCGSVGFTNTSPRSTLLSLREFINSLNLDNEDVEADASLNNVVLNGAVRVTSEKSDASKRTVTVRATSSETESSDRAQLVSAIENNPADRAKASSSLRVSSEGPVLNSEKYTASLSLDEEHRTNTADAAEVTNADGGDDKSSSGVNQIQSDQGVSKVRVDAEVKAEITGEELQNSDVDSVVNQEIEPVFAKNSSKINTDPNGSPSTQAGIDGNESPSSGSSGSELESGENPSRHRKRGRKLQKVHKTDSQDKQTELRVETGFNAELEKELKTLRSFHLNVEKLPVRKISPVIVLERVDDSSSQDAVIPKAKRSIAKDALRDVSETLPTSEEAVEDAEAPPSEIDSDDFALGESRESENFAVVNERQKTLSMLMSSDENSSESESSEPETVSKNKDSKAQKAKTRKAIKKRKRCQKYNLRSLRLSNKKDNDRRGSGDDGLPRTKRAVTILSSDESGTEKSQKSSSDENSEDAGTSSEEDDFAEQPRKIRKRRRLILKDSNSEDEEEDKANVGRGHRKDIRALIKEKDLQQATIDAFNAEKERRKRIAERQNLYNSVNLQEMPGSSTEPGSTRLVLEEYGDHQVIEVDPKLVALMKPHQIEGVQFLYQNTIESVEKISEPGGGCILAHSMGLGKTLQVVSFLHTVFTCKEFGLRTALIVSPVNVLLNWKSEFDLWLDKNDLSVWDIINFKALDDRMKVCQAWQQEGGALLISYSMLRLMVQGGKMRKKKAFAKKFAELLLDPGADIVICDEGHTIKNEKTGISKLMSSIKTKRRICLTGTPLQNNLMEYHCMLQFVKPNLLGTKTEFANRFANPIRNGQMLDSTDYDVRLMKRRAHILHDVLSGCVHVRLRQDVRNDAPTPCCALKFTSGFSDSMRKDYSCLRSNLTPKHEYVILVSLTDQQRLLYKQYLNEVVQKTLRGNWLNARNTLFSDFRAFQLIAAHPYCLIMQKEEQEQKLDFVDSGEEPTTDSNFSWDSSSTSSSSSSSSDERISGEFNKTVRSRSPSKEKTASETQASNSAGDNDAVPEPNAGNWFQDLVTEKAENEMALSSKLLILFELIRRCEAIGDKLLVFSQSLIALDIIENFIRNMYPDPPSTDQKAMGICTWQKDLDYFRIDGSTNVHQRRRYCSLINDRENLRFAFNVYEYPGADPSPLNKDMNRARLLLVSTLAGSLGANMVGANRVVIFDASWNPTHDQQAIFRVYRFGQTKPVYIYRLVAQGTMEEKIYDRQVTKLSLSCRVVDEQQIGRHFTVNDLMSLYEFNPADVSSSSVSAHTVPADRMLADILCDCCNLIVRYHEHDSLLQDLENEHLTEEERKAAWAEYEAERNSHLLPRLASNVDRENSYPLIATFLQNSLICHEMARGNYLIQQTGEYYPSSMENVVTNWISKSPVLVSDEAEIYRRLLSLNRNLERYIQNKRSFVA